MKIDLNDPRLTAYALGELADADRVAFEAQLAVDQEARQEVDRIQRAAGVLKEKLEAEPCPRLEPAQREVIYEQVEATGGLGSSRAAARLPIFRWWMGLLAGAAALVLVGSLMLPALSTARHKTRTLAVNTPPPVALHESKAGRDSDQFAALRNDTYTSQTLNGDGGTAGKGGGGIPTADSTPPPAPLATAPAYANNNGAPLHSESEVKIFRSTAEIAEKLAAADKERPLQGMTASTLTFNNAGAVGCPIVEPPLPGFAGPRIANSLELNRAFGSTIAPVPGTGAGLAGRGGTLRTSVTPLTKASGQIVGDLSGYVEDAQLNNSGQLYPRQAEVPAEVRMLDGQGNFNTITIPGTESYPRLYDNPFYAVTDQPLSTFGLDVDTASYSNIRRFLLNNQLPPRDAVRIEEMLNYFTYDYPAPRGREPFALYVEMGECPWNPAHQLALIGLKAKDVTARQQPPLNLVFLIDVSGSMADANKLPLIKRAFHLLVPQLDERDRVAIVVYASNARVALPSTRGDQHRRILSVIDELNADGSTNGGDGIQNAYAQASEHFIKGGVNRVILCTDGDFNVGITDQNDLTRLIEQKAASGVFLSVFGFGMGNLKDSTMQKLADKGNGHYAYIDDLDEARKVLVDQARSTIITVAKDVKLQVEFNPAQVQAYRLIGYEKRQLAARDFNNDRKDAGDLGTGHTVTALYEIVPAGEPEVDPLKYQPVGQASRLSRDREEQAGRLFNAQGEWATVKLRYKEPEADKSQLLTAALKNTGLRWRTASDDFQFAAAVATFGMTLRDSPYKGESSLDLALELAQAGRGRDVKGYRSEFIDLVKRASQLR